MPKKWERWSQAAERLRETAREKADDIADRADELAERAKDRADEIVERARDRGEEIVDKAHDLAESEGAERVAGKVKKVAVTALPFAPPEVLLSAAAVAALIKIADEKGLLESPAAKPLKDIALAINAEIPLDEGRILNTLPKLLKLGIVTKVMGDGKAAQRIRLAADMAAKGNGVRGVIKQMRNRGHGGPPERNGPGA